MTKCFLRRVATFGIANHFATFTLNAMRKKEMKIAMEKFNCSY